MPPAPALRSRVCRARTRRDRARRRASQGRKQWSTRREHAPVGAGRPSGRGERFYGPARAECGVRGVRARAMWPCRPRTAPFRPHGRARPQHEKNGRSGGTEHGAASPAHVAPPRGAWSGHGRTVEPRQGVWAPAYAPATPGSFPPREPGPRLAGWLRWMCLTGELTPPWGATKTVLKSAF